LDHRFSTEITPADRFYYNRLFYDYIFNYDLLKSYFTHDHRSTAGLRERMGEIKKNYDDSYREKIVPIVEEMNLKLGAGKKTLENIGRLSKKETAIVIGGQQPGLFTGPIFIIYKIITVLKLSHYIQEKTGNPVIPCFWNASDDSSLDQADRLGIPGNQLNMVKLDTSAVNKSSRLSNISLDRDLYLDIIKNIESLMPGRGLDHEALAMLESSLEQQAALHSQGKIGLAGLFSRIILKLFSGWGIVIIDPADVSFKELGSDFLKWDIRNHEKISKSIREKGEMLKEAGYHAQLEPNKDVLDFFININDARTKIQINPGGRFILGGKESPAGEILAAANSDPASVSWNVALRPLIQDTIFPVAATVCGPGEVSYFAQLGGIYDMKGVSMPVIYPRFSATIIEPGTSRSMKKTEISTHTLALDKQDAEKMLLKNNTIADPEEIISGLEAEIISSIKGAEEKIIKAGNDPGSAFDRIKRNLGNEVKVLSKKLFSALKKQNQLLVKSIDNIYGDLLPEGNLQERKINIFYYVSKYGSRTINTLYDAYMPSEKGHVFIYLERKEKDEAG